MYERITSRYWRLTPDMQRQIAALLLYLRQEYQWGEQCCTGDDLTLPPEYRGGSAKHYNRMRRCVDHMLSRIDSTWDMHRMLQCYEIVASCIDAATGRPISRYMIEKELADYGSLAIDSGWSRGDSAGYHIVPREGSDRRDDSGHDPESDRPSGRSYADNGPGGHSIDTGDSERAAGSSGHCPPDEPRRDSRDTE